MSTIHDLRAPDKPKHGIRIIHLADMDRRYEYALCGKKRERPLEPGATGDYCVVCLAEHKRRRGKDYA